MVLGKRQDEGVNYTKTFGQTVKMVAVRTFLIVSTIRKMELHEMDVHNAFLHVDL